jgi:hypothetical protein
MNDDEIAALYKAFPTRPDWVDYFITAQTFIPVLSEIPLEKGVPGGVAALNFPDLCTCARMPVGAYGYLGFPTRFQQRWANRALHLSGGFPYSEGIWEDLSKIQYAQLYWKADRSYEETLREYFAFEFSPDAAENLLKVAKIFEQNIDKSNLGPSADDAYEILQRVDATLTPQAKASWRWRVFFLRGVVDHELRQTRGKLEGPVVKSVFEELTKIYHGENAEWLLRMPKVPLPKKTPRDPTTVASSEFSADCHAGMACDGVRASQDENNFWGSANRQDVGAWWRKDLGNRHSIEKIRIQFRGFGGHYHFVPKTITFQVSDDGNAWTTAVSKSADVPANNSAYAATMHTYDINAQGRYVRLLFEDGTDDEVGNSKVVELVEVEVVRADSAPVGNK